MRAPRLGATEGATGGREASAWRASPRGLADDTRARYPSPVITRSATEPNNRHWSPRPSGSPVDKSSGVMRPAGAATINLRLAAVRRMADEASDTGLLSPDLAAAIRRVQGARRIGVRVGNWLSAQEGLRSAGKSMRAIATELNRQACAPVPELPGDSNTSGEH